MSLTIQKLTRQHRVDSFACGSEALDRFLVRFAYQNQQAEASQTYVALDGEEVVGYYTLVVGEIDYEDAPERLKKGLAGHPIPVMLLARMGVALSRQGQRLGSGLLKDAMLRTLQAAEIVGIRAFAVHAKDDTAARFYQHFGFLQSPVDRYHLYKLIKDIRAVLAKRDPGAGAP